MNTQNWTSVLCRPFVFKCVKVKVFGRSEISFGITGSIWYDCLEK